MAIDNVSQNLTLNRLATSNILNTTKGISSLATDGKISTDEFETVLNHYLTSYSNPAKRKNASFATALGTDEALIDELFATARGRKAIAEMSGNHLMDVVTTDASIRNASKKSSIQELKEQEAELSAPKEDTRSTLSSIADFIQQFYKKNVS